MMSDSLKASDYAGEQWQADERKLETLDSIRVRTAEESLEGYKTPSEKGSDENLEKGSDENLVRVMVSYVIGDCIISLSNGQ